MRRTKDRACSPFKTIIIIITVPACKSESQHRGSHKKVRYRLNSLCIRSRFPKKSAKVIVCVFLSTAAPFRKGATWRHDQKCNSQTQAVMQRLKFTLAKASLIPKRTFRHPLHHLYSRANFYTSVKWKILFSTFRDKPLKRGRAELPEDVAKLFFFQFVQSYWCPMPSFPVENFFYYFDDRATRKNASTCSVWDTWSQTSTGLQTAARAVSQCGVTHLEASAICPLPHTQTQRCSVIGRGDVPSLPSRGHGSGIIRIQTGNNFSFIQFFPPLWSKCLCEFYLCLPTGHEKKSIVHCKNHHHTNV